MLQARIYGEIEGVKLENPHWKLGSGKLGSGSEIVEQISTPAPGANVIEQVSIWSNIILLKKHPNKNLTSYLFILNKLHLEL